MNWIKTSFCGFTMLLSVMAFSAYGQEGNINFNTANPDQAQPLSSGQSGSEHLTVHGRRAPPPGYTYAPSMELQHGLDPEHKSSIARDPVSGANLSRFGTAYQESGPVGQGKVGDATGNAWLTPR